MAIIDRIRELRDDIIYRHYPVLRQHSPFVFSALFLIAFATALITTYFGDTSKNGRLAAETEAEFPVLGATLRLSRISERPERPEDTSRARIQASEANDPTSPMLIEIDPENGAVHGSAGSIKIKGMPINIGTWSLD